MPINILAIVNKKFSLYIIWLVPSFPKTSNRSSDKYEPDHCEKKKILDAQTQNSEGDT